MTTPTTNLDSPRPHTVTLDRATKRLLSVIAVLLAVLIVELWALRPDSTNPAHAQIPDTGLQRQQIVDEQRRTNDLLSATLEHLRTKPIKVRVEASEKPAGQAKRGDRP
ncbi:hypothetical protein RAS2_01900 [Phycisphaerae bacterium RAS2]|nr:hypothetical protein RAS2_01900 [Phycisphaerae bacterium RAS2]